MVKKKAQVHFGNRHPKNKNEGEEMREKLTQGLSQDQADAMMLMIDYVKDPGNDMFVLKGYAGTGKTYLIKHLINYISQKYPGNRIAITAPTNKAVGVLSSRKDLKDWYVTYHTIHSLLKLTETITSDGRVIFVSKNDISDISKYYLLIVDEVSMLQDDIFKLLLKSRGKIRIIFVGDPAQIPPVGKIDCIPFQRPLSLKYEEGYTLRQIMRQQAGNPIVEAFFKLRDNLNVERPLPELKTQKNINGHGLVWVDSTVDRERMLHLLESYFVCKKFQENPDYAKVIAWRNRSVDAINKHIRHMIYGDALQKIMIGEKLLANRPIFSDDQEIIFNTSEEFEIEKFVIIEKKKWFGNKLFQSKVYECIINKPMRAQNVGMETIYIIHEDSMDMYKTFLEELKKKAIDTAGKDKSWISYYDAVKWPADIAYNYAITAHKSQGSTYQNVFIMEDDIDLNKNIVERNRIKYTAYSRASETLYIYRSY